MNTPIENAERTGAPKRIRELNDRLRKARAGGQIVLTSGIAAEAKVTVLAILNAVANFEAFSADNDPWNEHDCAALKVAGIDVIWKIDYYDLQLTNLSSDPSDPAVTRRVLTIMRADEY